MDESNEEDDDSVSSEVEAYLYSQIHYESKQEPDHEQPSNSFLIDTPGSQQQSGLTNVSIKPIYDILQRTPLGSELYSKPSSSTVSDACAEPVVKVLHHSELQAEKANRKKPDGRKEAFSFTRHLVNLKSRKSPIKKPTIVIDDSSDSDVIIEDLADQDQKVVINLDGSSDDSCVVVENAADNALWRINTEDKFHFASGEMNVRCYNCNEKGHLSRSCPQPKKMIHCYQCGEPGHFGDRCPNPLCSKCLLFGHQHTQCRWIPNQTALCPLCRTKGHLCRDCPSIWRRYHLTTSAGPAVTPQGSKVRQNKLKSCYNCGRSGHYGHECTKKRAFNFIFPVARTVQDYSDPRKVVFTSLNLKLWKKKVRLANRADEAYQQKTATKGEPRSKKRRIAHHPKWSKGKIEAPNVVRINPAAETAFPRTNLKLKQTSFKANNANIGTISKKARRKRKRGLSKSDFKSDKCFRKIN